MNREKAIKEAKSLIRQIYFYNCAQDYRNVEICESRLGNLAEEAGIARDELIKMMEEYDFELKSGYYKNWSDER